MIVLNTMSVLEVLLDFKKLSLVEEEMTSNGQPPGCMTAIHRFT